MTASGKAGWFSRRFRRSVPATTLLATVIGSLHPVAASAASFQGLGTTIAGWSPSTCWPWDISPDGSAVVGTCNAIGSADSQAFLWTATSGMVGLGTLGGEDFESTALGVTSEGELVVGTSSSPKSGSGHEAFRWTASTGMVGLGDLPGGEFGSYVSDASFDGTILCGRGKSEIAPHWGEAVRWTESTGLVGLGVLPGGEFPFSAALAISADGRVIVGTTTSSNWREAFRWNEAEGMVGLGLPPDDPLTYTEAWGVSADGSVILIVADGFGFPRSFRWTETTGMVELPGPPGSDRHFARDISWDGSVAVGEAAVPVEYGVPTIWNEAQGTRNLINVLEELGLGQELEGWDLEAAMAVSADGLTVMGWGYNPDGDHEAWIAYLGQSVLEIPTISRKALLPFGALLAVAALVSLRRSRGGSATRSAAASGHDR